ncbi:unnamed protein product, partial [Cyprideis torosa]
MAFVKNWWAVKRKYDFIAPPIHFGMVPLLEAESNRRSLGITMSLISCILLLWTLLADAAEARIVEPRKTGNEPVHLTGDMRIINGYNARLGGLGCYASGWGKTQPNNNTLPSNLQWASLQALTDNQCSPFITGYVDEAHLCTFDPPRNICSDMTWHKIWPNDIKAPEPDKSVSVEFKQFNIEFDHRWKK